MMFSSNGQQVACWAQRGRNWFIVVDGVESDAYDGFIVGSRLVFDDSRQLHALAARNGEILLLEIRLVQP